MHAWPKFGGCGSKNEAATPFRSSKLKRTWQAQFLSHSSEILHKHLFFKDLQMMFIRHFHTSTGFRFWKNAKEWYVQAPVVLELIHHFRGLRGDWGGQLIKSKVTSTQFWYYFRLFVYDDICKTLIFALILLILCEIIEDLLVFWS